MTGLEPIISLAVLVIILYVMFKVGAFLMKLALGFLAFCLCAVVVARFFHWM